MTLTKLVTYPNYKLSSIIPVPKKSVISCNNDLRPVALTSVVMKASERFALNALKTLVAPFLDPMQFAYTAKRNTEDAVLFILEQLYSHLEKSRAGNTARVLYFDFSSAFNTIQPHLLARKLIDMNLPANFITWILNYLTKRSQYVSLKTSSTQSDVLYTNTGAPQGTVLAPFLFTVYTSDIRSSNENCSIVKFADDTALIGLIKKDNSEDYIRQVETFVKYCDENFLQLNVSKTKEMVIDYRTLASEPESVIIKGSTVERIKTYKYLGLVIDNKLAWKEHIEYLCKKLRSRMYCLRKMKKFHVNAKILRMFYDSVLSSIWKYCLTAWGGNCRKVDQQNISSVIKQASRVIGEDLPSFDCIHETFVTRKFNKIWKDSLHPLNNTFHNAVSARSNRLILPYACTNRHKSSFVVQAMLLYNKATRR